MVCRYFFFGDLALRYYFVFFVCVGVRACVHVLACAQVYGQLSAVVL